MRVLFMGQTGLDKKGYLERLASFCSSQGRSIDRVFNLGDMMYEISEGLGKPVPPGKILDLPLTELRLLRRLAFNAIVNDSVDSQNVLVNSHSVFRWSNQLFSAIDHQELALFGPDLIITLIDDIDAIKLRLDTLRQQGQLPSAADYTLKDIIVWREEEILVSDLLASVLHVPHYLVGAWLEPEVVVRPEESAYRLIFESWRPRAYVSYPISIARPRPELWSQITRFRRLVHKYLTAFDPLTIAENSMRAELVTARSQDSGIVELRVDVRGTSLNLAVNQVEEVLPDIDGQIVARDYKLIDQSQMVIAYFPKGDDGSPIIAGGVQSEIEHAAASTKNIVIVWEAQRDPTPFIGLKADNRFSSLEELESYLRELGQPTGQLEMPV